MEARNPDAIISLPPFAHEVRGKADGPWITFVPGIGNDRHFWAAQAEALSSDFRILLFDPWGHGQSPPPPSPCNFETIVDGLVQLWTSLNINRTVVVGLGFGGSVALAAAATYPAYVEKLVACCCRPRQPDDRRQFWRDRKETAAKIGMEAMGDITVDRWLSVEFRKARPDVDRLLRAMFARTSLAGYAAYTSAFAEMDITDALSMIAAPTLLLAGEHDHGGGPVKDMQLLAETIRTAELVVVPDAGHIVPYEASDQVTAILINFLCGDMTR